MPVKTYSLKTEGNNNISANFKVKEFRCLDGSDKILIANDLSVALQKIRDHFGEPITINSGYRTAAHNKAQGGSPNSQHLQGKAADIVVKGTAPLIVAQFAEALGLGGVGLYPSGQGNFVHIDTRAGRSRWKKQNGKEVAVSNFGGKSFAQQVQEAAGLEAQTMAYLQAYKYADALMYKLAEAMHKKAAKSILGYCYNQVQRAAGLDDGTMAYLQEYVYGDILLGKLAAAMN